MVQTGDVKPQRPHRLSWREFQDAARGWDDLPICPRIRVFVSADNPGVGSGGGRSRLATRVTFLED